METQVKLVYGSQFKNQPVQYDVTMDGPNSGILLEIDKNRNRGGVSMLKSIAVSATRKIGDDSVDSKAAEAFWHNAYWEDLAFATYSIIAPNWEGEAEECPQMIQCLACGKITRIVIDLGKLKINTEHPDKEKKYTLLRPIQHADKKITVVTVKPQLVSNSEALQKYDTKIGEGMIRMIGSCCYIDGKEQLNTLDVKQMFPRDRKHIQNIIKDFAIVDTILHGTCKCGGDAEGALNIVDFF